MVDGCRPVKCHTLGVRLTHSRSICVDGENINPVTVYKLIYVWLRVRVSVTVYSIINSTMYTVFHKKKHPLSFFVISQPNVAQ